MKVDVISCMLDVLQSNKPVALPGLGQWQVDHVTSEIKGNRIYPPYKSILFNEKVGSPVSLSNCIRKKYNISKKGADQVVQRFSKLIINRLVNYREVYIPRLGTLKSNGEKSLHFLEKQPNSINLSKVILPSFGLIPVEKEEVKVVQPSPVTPKAAITQTSTSNNTPIAPAYYGEEKGCLAQFFWPLFWLALLALLCFFLLKKCNSFTGTADDNTQSSITDDNTDNSDSINTDLDKFDRSKEYLLTEIDQIPDAIFDEGCVIIVGSYRKSRNVLRMKAELRAQGKDVYTEVISNGLTRVGFNLDCDRESVGNLIKTTRKDINGRSWYLKPKIKVNY